MKKAIRRFCESLYYLFEKGNYMYYILYHSVAVGQSRLVVSITLSVIAPPHSGMSAANPADERSESGG